jgi:HEPN domain-containing protein
MRKTRRERRAEARANKPAPDPLTVYLQAERFRIADRVLREDSVLQQVGASVAAPSMVLAAFSAELFLKCLFVIETGRDAPEIHELRKLFLLLSDDARSEIEASWDDYVLQPRRAQVYEVLEQNFGRPIPRDLRWSLRTGGDGFSVLRYAHEPQNANHTFLLGDFHYMVRKAILRRRPDWAKLRHTSHEITSETRFKD